jgi:NTP pyrophosphatase (non-canonical NTP hydrolase)
MNDGLAQALSYLGFEGNDIATMQAIVTEVNKANGWFDSNRSFGDDIALLHSEVSEAFEAYREHGLVDATTYLSDDNHTPGKPEGVGSELADVLVRLLDTCERYDIDLEQEFNRKVKYNATRGYRHGGKLV